jgi:predicted nucleic acid-binding Zn ribbon protein
VIRVISGGGGIILKGNGFYATDYRSDAYKKAARADRPGSDTSTKDSKNVASG